MTSPPRHLPEFAQRWMEQWRHAAPELRRIRDEELRNLPAEVDMEDQSGEPEHGLVIQQRWFMRMQLLKAFGRDE